MYIPFWLEITAHFVEVHFFVIFKLILRSRTYILYIYIYKIPQKYDTSFKDRLFDQKIISLDLGGREAVRSLQPPKTQPKRYLANF